MATHQTRSGRLVDEGGGFLRLALRLDAVATGAGGLLCLAGGSALDGPLGIPFVLLAAVGALLILFAAFVWVAGSRRTSGRAVWTIIAINAAYATGCVAVVATGLFSLTALGVSFVLVQAAAVALFAILQLIGLRRSQHGVTELRTGVRKEDQVRVLSGPLLMAIGALDLLYVLVFHSRQLAAIAGDGIFDAVEIGPAHLDREVAFWHLTCGITFLLLGRLVRWTQARTGALPAFMGWSLLALGLFGAALVPVSGFWAFPPLAVLMLLTSRRDRRETPNEDEKTGKPLTGENI